MEIQESIDLPVLASRREALSAEQCLEIFEQLAAQLAEFHRRGLLHRDVSLDRIRIQGDEGTVLLDAPGGKVTFGGPFADVELCPPEYRQGTPFELSSDLTEARHAFLQARRPEDPLRIDVFQLAAVFCRLLVGGRPVAEYLRSARAQSTVPTGLREILDRTLGSTGDDRIVTLTGLRGAIQQFRVAARKTTDIELPQPVSSPSEQETPSHGGSIGADGVVGEAPRRSRPGEAPRESRSGEGGRVGAGTGASTSAAHVLPFTALGHYRILQLLGQGGMGDVYLAYEEQLDRQVAIKVLPAELSRHSDFVQRFRAEATAAARLSHPAIVPIYFIGEDRGVHFFVMQYIDGESLADILYRRVQLPWQEAVAFIEQILAGLSVAHANGLVHRDIKPGNLLWDRQRQCALLADFGVAKAIRASAGLTATGTVLGTADYFSPEQGRGQAVDQRSDLYSVGCVLYRMLSGQLPFNGDSSTSLIFQHVYEPPPPLCGHAPQVPLWLSEIVHRLLSKDPQDRFPDANAVLDALRQQRVPDPRPSSPPAVSAAMPEKMLSTPGQRQPAPLESAPLLPGGAPEPRWPETNGWFANLLAALQRYLPDTPARLQNTQQQVDGAIVAYERRERTLRSLAQDAEQVCAELLAQEQQRRQEAKQARRQADAAKGDNRARLEAEADAQERDLQELTDLRHEQQSELGKIQVEFAKVSSRLQSMRSQRELLNARLQAILAKNPELAPARKRLTTRQFGLAAGCCAVLMVALIVGVKFLRSPQSIEETSQLAVVPPPPLSILPRSAPAASPPPVAPKEFRLETFNGKKFDAGNWAVRRSSSSQADFLRDNLHAVIAPRNEGNANVTMVSRFRLEGDFDIRADYTIHAFPKPKSDWSNISILVSGPNGSASTSRTNHAQLGEIYTQWYEGPGSPKQGNWRNLKTIDPAGTLRLLRIGRQLRFLAAATGKDFQEIGTVDYGTDAIEKLMFAVIRPPHPEPAEVSLDNISVEADRIQAIESPMMAPPAPSAPGNLDASEAEKQIAKRLLDLGLAVELTVPNGRTPLNSDFDLASGQFAVRFVTVGPNHKLSAADYESIAELPGFEKLNALFSPVTDANLAVLAKSGKLTEIALLNTQVTPNGLNVLKSVKSLRDLNLGGAQFVDEALAPLAAFDQLTNLNLTYSRATDGCLPHIKSLRNLDTLTLNERKITDAGVAQLSELTNLENLWLEDTPSTGEGFRNLSFPRLTALWIKRSGLTDAGMQQICHACPNLRLLDVSRTAIGDAALESISGLKNLGSLNLSQTRVTREGVSRLSSLSDLRTLTVSRSTIPPFAVDELKAKLPQLSVKFAD